MIPTTILLLGRCCKIVFAMERIHLKNKSGLFDWVDSSDFEDILYCINKLNFEEDLSIEHERPGFPRNIFIKGTNIRTSHYKYEEYKKIIKRRSNRFIEVIKGNNPILFIREDLTHFTTKEQLIQFKDIIYKINPECNYKFLLLTPPEKFIKIDEDKFFCEINDESKYEDYINKICGENRPIKVKNYIRMEKDY
jgi:hypothetical protein